MKQVVLMLNDHALGIYSTENLARLAAKAHEDVFFKYHSEHSPRFYHTHEFVVDSPAHF